MHIPVLVTLGLLPALEPKAVLHAVDTVLSPWLTSDDKHWRWDWYQIGGRWRGLFDATAGADALEGSPGVPEMMSLRASGIAPEALGADVVRLRDIDWDSTAVRHGGHALAGAAAGELENGGVLLPVTAIVLEDGSLIEFGGPLWGEASPSSKALWQQTWRSVLARLPEETVIALVDCHE